MRASFAPMRSALLAAAVLGLAAALTRSAHAQVTFITTLSSANPTFNRPIAGTPPTSTSSLVYYSPQQFTVSTAGSYTIATIAAALVNNLSPTDTHLELYQNVFNPTTPLVNCLASDDDSGGNSLSSITINLVAGTQYFAIPTTFSTLATGTITTRISGPGTITLITPAAAPEPGSLALVAVGALPLAGMVIRRRRKTA